MAAIIGLIALYIVITIAAEICKFVGPRLNGEFALPAWIVRPFMWFGNAVCIWAVISIVRDLAD